MLHHRTNANKRALVLLQANKLPCTMSFTFTISEDGNTITQRVQFNDGDSRTWAPLV
jgi:hypothetical protein